MTNDRRYLLVSLPVRSIVGAVDEVRAALAEVWFDDQIAVADVTGLVTETARRSSGRAVRLAGWAVPT